MFNPYALAIDLDGTATDARQECTLMRDVEASAVPYACRVERLNELRNLYMPRYKAGQLPAEEERKWHHGIVDAYVEHGVTLHDMFAAIAHVRFRPGFHRFLREQKARDVSVAIVSFGVRQLIQQLFWQNDVSLDLIDEIYAMDLTVDRSLRVTGIVEGSLVIPADKGRVSCEFADRYGIPHDRIIGIGDSAGDRLIGHLQTMRIGIFEDPSKAKTLREFMGHVVQAGLHGSFDPVSRVVDELVGWSETHRVPPAPQQAVAPLEQRTILYPCADTTDWLQHYHIIPVSWHQGMGPSDVLLPGNDAETVECACFPEDTHTNELLAWAAGAGLEMSFDGEDLVRLGLALPGLTDELGPILSTYELKEGRDPICLDKISGKPILATARQPNHRWPARTWFAFRRRCA